MVKGARGRDCFNEWIPINHEYISDVDLVGQGRKDGGIMYYSRYAKESEGYNIDCGLKVTL